MEIPIDRAPGTVSVESLLDRLATAEATLTSYADAIALVDAIPATDQGDSTTIWNDAGVLKVSGSGG
jgi:hypothetical protein